MDSFLRPMRLRDPWLSVRPTLVGFLPMTWYWADTVLRTELQSSIAALVGRRPDLLPPLRRHATNWRPPSGAGLNPQAELAGLLLTLWVLGDAPLRTEVEAMISGYAGRHGSFGEQFLALARTAREDSRMMGVLGHRAEAQSRLDALLDRLNL